MDADSPRLRLSILGVVVFSLFAALFARLWYLQVMATDQGEVEAAANRVRVIQEDAPRGRILDAKGRVIVGNRTSLVVTIDPHQLADLKKDARSDLLLRLAQELTSSGTPTKVAAIQRRLDDPQYSPLQPIPVAIDVPEELQVYLAERADEFPSVQVRRESVRYYPEKSLAAHVVGYVGRISPEEYEAKMGTADAPKDPAKPYQAGSDIGKTGVERVHEDDLRGIPGIRKVEVDAKGKVIRTIEYRPPQPGNDVQLNIDIDVQRVTEEHLAEQLSKVRNTYTRDGRLARAPAGSAVVLDPTNGAVVAMASYPTYDPSEFVNGISYDRYEQLVGGDAADNPFINRAIGGLYAPGSTFKLTTAYAALTKGVIDGNTWVADGGEYKVGNQTFRNAEGAVYGSVNMPRALTVSSDVYFYRLGDLFWSKRDQFGDGIQEAARQFGFGAPSGIDLPGELGGVVPDPAWKKQLFESLPADQQANGDPKWYTGDSVNLAIGQGDLLATPLQIANSYGTFADRGRLHAPQVVMRVLQPDTDATDPSKVDCAPGSEGCAVVRTIEPTLVHQFDIADDVYQPIHDGLLGVTRDPNGTAHQVFDGFDLNAFPIIGKTGTAQVNDKADNGLFVAYGPSESPRYVAVAVLEQAGFGSDTAAPVVRGIMDVVSGQVLPGCADRPDPAAGPVTTTSSTPGSTSTTSSTVPGQAAAPECPQPEAGESAGTGTDATGGSTTTPTTTWTPPTTAWSPPTTAWSPPTTAYVTPTTSYVTPTTGYPTPTTGYPAPTTAYVPPTAVPGQLRVDPTASAPGAPAAGDPPGTGPAPAGSPSGGGP